MRCGCLPPPRFPRPPALPYIQCSDPPQSDRSRGGRRRFYPLQDPAPVRLPPFHRPGPAFPPTTTAAAVPAAAGGARADHGAVISVHALRPWVAARRRPRPNASGRSRGLHRKFRSSVPARNWDVRRGPRERERADGQPSIRRGSPPSGPGKMEPRARLRAMARRCRAPATSHAPGIRTGGGELATPERPDAAATPGPAQGWNRTGGRRRMRRGPYAQATGRYPHPCTRGEPDERAPTDPEAALSGMGTARGVGSSSCPARGGVRRPPKDLRFRAPERRRVALKYKTNI